MFGTRVALGMGFGAPLRESKAPKRKTSVIKGTKTKAHKKGHKAQLHKLGQTVSGPVRAESIIRPANTLAVIRPKYR